MWVSESFEWWRPRLRGAKFTLLDKALSSTWWSGSRDCTEELVWAADGTPEVISHDSTPVERLDRRVRTVGGLYGRRVEVGDDSPDYVWLSTGEDSTEYESKAVRYTVGRERGTRLVSDFASIVTPRGRASATAKAETQEERVLIFANEYGALGIGERLRRVVEESFEGAYLVQRLDDKVVNGESYARWLSEAAAVDSCYGALLALRSEQTERVERAYRSLAGEDAPKGLVKAIPALWEVLGDVVGRHIQRGVGVGVRVAHDNPARLTAELLPDSLLSCIWLYLLEMSSASQNYGVCKECKQVYRAPQIEGERERQRRGLRSNREYCSDACRQRNYRREHPEKKAKKGTKGDAVKAPKDTQKQQS